MGSGEGTIIFVDEVEQVRGVLLETLKRQGICRSNGCMVRNIRARELVSQPASELSNGTRKSFASSASTQAFRLSTESFGRNDGACGSRGKASGDA